MGSSPLTRGKRTPVRRPGAAHGLIPAHAGKTFPPALRRCRSTAHPRSRGENLRAGKPCALSVGSSPLTRGKPGRVIEALRTGRLIPAHAGKTWHGSRPDPAPTAHPRSRAENDGTCRSGSLRMGSSPLTRGKHSLRSGDRRAHRLIPAHAGKTRAIALYSCSSRAHPRSRGENAFSEIVGIEMSGSSPLTRGKHLQPVPRSPLPGLIPAHAGKTLISARSPFAARAHPRSRGENKDTRHASGTFQGSSPLTRGKPATHPANRSGAGLIPAHAGKTITATLFPWVRRAHPRSRGENHAIVHLFTRLTGSSPLTRGKHFLTCAFIAQIDQILESLELCAFSESYSSQDVYATDAPRDRVRSIDLGLRSSRGAS